MTFRLYDTAARQIREFTPKVAGQVGIYLCGATVQSEPHLGHMRSGVSYDVLRRWLNHLGNEVTFIRNVTDIDDKILVKAPEQGREWWALSYENERAFAHGYLTLGCLPPTYEPRATGHVPEMIELMHTLIATGHAYTAGGDVFFDVHSYPEYGALSNQKLENMRGAEDADVRFKHDARDFALWKGVKPHEPVTASWATPWGQGRPGWHLECSAMVGKYLGDEFDIHGGGVDLIFPHHENEIAQSKAAERPFARYWVHHALVSLGGEKMSKSVGNAITLPAIFAKHRPIEVRYYLASPHYRSIIDYSEESLAEAAVGFGRIEGFVRRASERFGATPSDGVLPEEFIAAMNDDLATPRAFGVVHDLVRHGNQALADNDDDRARESLFQVRSMLGILGMDPLDEKWEVAPADGLHEVVDALIGVVMEQRQAARERKDYAAADAIRDQLKSSGLTIEDTPQGPRWSLS